MEHTLEQYDDYIRGLFAGEDEALRAAREEIEKAGLPLIHVSATEGKALHQLALLAGARRILEIGTLGGYSAIWLARALPEDGRLLSLEIDPHHADVSRRNLERAGLSHKVEVILGPAAATLERLQTSETAPFDVVFIDADKEGYPRYLDLCLPMVRQGGLILADNTLSHSALEPGADTGITRYNNAVAANPGLVSIILPVLRHGGIDGLLVSLKR